MNGAVTSPGELRTDDSGSGVTASRALKALRSPWLAIAALRAQLALRKCGRVPLSTRLQGRVRVENYGGRIELSDRIRIDGRTVPVELVCVDSTLSIGEGTYLNYGSSISSHRGVRIGKNCLIGNYALIMDSDYHSLTDRSLPGDAAPIEIDDDAWIATRAIVLKGVRIGAGAVVAAGAVVTEDVPPRTLVAGVPAKVVRSL
jgi:acetyltransferase-like isoleucine patch superfamily enzyme